jgi:uncharacterized protein (TIGR00251 family)
MAPRKYRLHDGKGGAALVVRVVPRAGRTAIAEVLADGTVRIQLRAAPVDGEANRELVKLLSTVLKVPKSRIEIVGGIAGRQKLVSILGMDAELVHQRIAAQLE